ncbi:dTDP-4-dehydrorhamnose 3,5-epimerase family protein [Candidatus Aminicenantes bacterium AH-873-B07]|jgi:dTDP-4-dehydrorhamnose 3,5-epimerase|nr:dTDP-4-dehydrorhamnose 3,5-epimerase family protein [Candidatus Aminicenantes bacterium AH-873-B07]
MIEGVKLKKLKVIPDERGRLMEILRSDDNLFIKFGQVYMTTTYPGVVKAWHLHKKQFDNVACLYGTIKLVLFDAREESPTYKEINEFYIGIHNPLLIQIPPRIYHGWKCVSLEEAIVVNIPTEVYNYEKPDEYRLDPHNNNLIPYDWRRKDG